MAVASTILMVLVQAACHMALSFTKGIISSVRIVGPDESVDFVGFSKSGNLIAGNYDKTELADMKAMEGITFGPPLIVDGKKMITDGDGGWGVGPRTAIGQRKDGTVLFVVIDGRQPGYSLGATLRDVQDVLYEKGAYIAANLDWWF